MASASVMASLGLKSFPSSSFLERQRFRGVQSSVRSSSLRVMAKKTKKIQTSQPFGPAGGLNFKDGVDASGRPAKVSFQVTERREKNKQQNFSISCSSLMQLFHFDQGKGVYQFANKYGANVDGYSPIYNPEEWSPAGDVYVGGISTRSSSLDLCRKDRVVALGNHSYWNFAGWCSTYLQYQCHSFLKRGFSKANSVLQCLIFSCVP
ncbi:hypothetical protein PR202_ga28377 [Eleusine coracana subsp. coracana]|uniref:Photosystem II 10 kDa polypeptide, chloroplastic n=1 Tax=Eleusine coracana subsp. coracana TaxID=191504 RepID=A0AAV5DIJ3_ELECO|nr:hypothetical protein PR202_ga28377 [Eleusine coracana subsp. coracana]